MKKKLKFYVLFIILIGPFVIEAAIRTIVLMPLQWLITGKTTVADTMFLGDVIYNLATDNEK